MPRGNPPNHGGRTPADGRGPVVLAVEDEEDILELIRYNLDREGYRVLTARSGEEALDLAAANDLQLILLDILLPGIDGFEVCRRLRSDPRTLGIPILFLTAKTEEIDIVTGLELGAEDYVTKPFSPRVLLARVRTILRRTPRSQTPPGIIRQGRLEIDPGRHRVRIDGQPVTLTLTEFKILHTLAGKPGWVFRRDQLLDAVQGPDSYVLDRTVDVHVGALRKKLGDLGGCVETVRGVGYRLSDTS